MYLVSLHKVWFGHKNLPLDLWNTIPKCKPLRMGSLSKWVITMTSVRKIIFWLSVCNVERQTAHILPVIWYTNTRNSAFFLLGAGCQSARNLLSVHTAMPSYNLAFHIRECVTHNDRRTGSCLHSHELWLKFVGVKRCKPINLVIHPVKLRLILPCIHLCWFKGKFGMDSRLRFKLYWI